MGIILYLFAALFEFILSLLFGVATIIYYLFTLKWWGGLKAIDKYYYHRALAKDQYGNVRFKLWMNKWMAKIYKKPYYYGDEDDTISYVTAMNYYKNLEDAKGLLKFVAKGLEKAEKNHLKKAIQNKIQRDIEANERLMAAGIIPKNVLSNKTPILESWINYVDHVQNKPR